MDVRLKPLGAPSPLWVRTSASGRPLEVRRPDRREGERVVAVHESWRIDDEWWRKPISRLYHQVVLESGKLMTVYRDLSDGSWYTQ
jgi:hypothetical protein